MQKPAPDVSQRHKTPVRRYQAHAAGAVGSGSPLDGLSPSDRPHLNGIERYGRPVRQQLHRGNHAGTDAGRIGQGGPEWHGVLE